jgi:hypothetical protein
MMTARYARLSDATIRRHWEAARKVNINGQAVTIDRDGPLAEAAWAKQRAGRAIQALPNGYCGLPVVKACPHANAPLTDLPDVHHHPHSSCRSTTSSASRSSRSSPPPKPAASSGWLR